MISPKLKDPSCRKIYQEISNSNFTKQAERINLEDKWRQLRNMTWKPKRRKKEVYGRRRQK